MCVFMHNATFSTSLACYQHLLEQFVQVRFALVTACGTWEQLSPIIKRDWKPCFESPPLSVILERTGSPLFLGVF